MGDIGNINIILSCVRYNYGLVVGLEKLCTQAGTFRSERYQRFS